MRAATPLLRRARETRMRCAASCAAVAAGRSVWRSWSDAEPLNQNALNALGFGELDGNHYVVFHPDEPANVSLHDATLFEAGRKRRAANERGIARGEEGLRLFKRRSNR
jgi:hypothetical protein